MSSEVPDGPSIQDDPKATTSQKRAALIWYGVGTVLLALYLGAAAGLSRSPVIGTLLPLLFSVLGGAGGLYLAKTDLEDSVLARRTKSVGMFIALLAASVIVGSIYGISIRTGTGLRSFVPSWRGSATEKASGILQGSDEEFVHPAQALELGALRLRLRALGFTEQEESRILESARYELFERVPELALVAYLRRAADRALATGAYFSALSESRKAHPEDEVTLVANIQSRTQGLAEGLEKYASYIEAGDSFNMMNLYREVSDGIQTTYWMEDMLGLMPSQTPRYFGGAASRESILLLRRKLLDLNVQIWNNRKLDWMTREELTSRIDALIREGGLQALTEKGAKEEPYFEAR